MSWPSPAIESSTSAAGTRAIGILLIDRRSLIRSGIRLVLEAQPNLRVLGEIDEAQSVSDVAAQLQPDMVLIDPEIVICPDLSVIPRIIAAAPRAKIVLLTTRDDPDSIRHAMSLGAMGAVSKTQPAETLIMAIEKVLAGEVWVERRIAADVISRAARADAAASSEQAKIASLTPRERDAIRCIATAMSNHEIAIELGISEGTVRHHLRSVFHKLDVADRLCLVVYAFRHGLAPLPR